MMLSQAALLVNSETVIDTICEEKSLSYQIT